MLLFYFCFLPFLNLGFFLFSLFSISLFSLLFSFSLLSSHFFFPFLFFFPFGFHVIIWCTYSYSRRPVRRPEWWKKQQKTGFSHGITRAWCVWHALPDRAQRRPDRALERQAHLQPPNPIQSSPIDPFFSFSFSLFPFHCFLFFSSPPPREASQSSWLRECLSRKRK